MVAPRPHLALSEVASRHLALHRSVLHHLVLVGALWAVPLLQLHPLLPVPPVLTHPPPLAALLASAAADSVPHLAPLA